MDYYAELEKRKQTRLGEIGQLAYEHYQLCKQQESIQKRIAEIDGLIAEKEMAIYEDDQAQRNFNTYLAIKEGAMTTRELADAIKEGAEIPEIEKEVKDA